MKLKLKDIVLDKKAQPREKIISSVVAEYAAAMKAGDSFPPVVVYSDGKKNWLADGWHRYLSKKKNGDADIECDVKKGKLRDAILHAVGANGEHGERRNNQDKHRAVDMLLADKEWQKWSDREIARRCKVSDFLVRTQRKKLTAISRSDTRKYVDKHGVETEMDTTAIGKAGAGKSEEKPSKGRAYFNRTNDNIGWAAWSWNPVVGCKHGCAYCYARDIANRFYGHFEPTYFEERLPAPGNTDPIVNIPGGNRVFVCSMSDLFGTWVPNEWILSVMAEVDANPQWTFLFLTKNPRRYKSVVFPSNAWIGATVDKQSRVEKTEEAMAEADAPLKFVSCEPLLGPVKFSRPEIFDWFLIGAKSEGKKKVQPETGWTLDLMAQARSSGKKVWMKDNLELIQENP